MPLWVAVHGVADGEDVKAEVLNRPLNELTERTNYLKQQFDVAVGTAFESIRLTGVPIASDVVPGDIVYLDGTTKVYRKALATVDAMDAFLASPQAYAIGIVTAVSGTTASLALQGRIPLATSGSAWAVANLLATTETFRNGSYYLSATTAGKLTANPSGIAIYIGEFTANATTPTNGDFAILNPQYKDTRDAHVHRAYPLYDQPAGTQEFTGTLPTDIHKVHGFNVIGTPAGGDHIPRLVISGSWRGTDAVQYTVWLSNSGGTTRLTSSPPTDFSDAYLHWLSSDPVEGQGKVRIWSYEVEVAIGTKGLVMALENTLEETTPTVNGLWDEAYVVAADAPDLRTWQFTAPDAVYGWLANRKRQTFTDHPAVDNKYSLLMLWGPHDAGDGRATDAIVVKCEDHYNLDYTANPVDGDTITVAGLTFEMDTDASVGAGNVLVPIDAGDVDNTYASLLSAIIAAGLVDVDVMADFANDRLVIATGALTAVASLTNATLSAKVLAAGDLAIGSGSMLVYDKDHNTLTAGAGNSTWVNPLYWEPKLLDNGLMVMAVPFDTDGSAATASTFASLDYWNTDIIDEAPGAHFKYAVAIQQNLAVAYPPVPKGSAVLVNNGVELARDDMFPEAYDYGFGNTAIYWYSNAYGAVPWPRDWVSVASPGSPDYIQNLVLHSVKMSAGDAGIVTSLRPVPGSPLKVVRCGTTEPATTGDLALDLDLVFTDDNAALAGYTVLKRLDGNKLRRGAVVEKIVAGPGISVTSGIGEPAGQGTVMISSAANYFGGDFEEVALENAKQEMIGMFPYIRLLEPGIPTGFTAKFRVPHNIGDGKYRVIVYITVFGETSIPWVGGGSRQFAGIAFSYSVLPDYYNPFGGADAPAYPWVAPTNPQYATLNGTIIAPAARVADIPLGKYDPAHTGGANIYDAYDPMLIHNNTSEPDADEHRKLARVLGDPFPNATESPSYPYVTRGDLVAIRISRTTAMSAPAYSGKLGFINIRWQLIAVA